MKFSIIVPVYNVEPYLRDCLESILLQSFDDYEVICVNDASTDSSLKILQSYAQKYKEIKIINNPVNGGLSFSRNCGLKNAVGEYILFVDSDDMLCQGALRTLSEEVNRLSTDIIYFNMIVKDEGQWAKAQIKSPQKQCKCDGIYTGQELFVKLYKNEQIIVEACRQLFSKKFIDENQLYFYEGILHEDILFSVVCAMKAQQVRYLEKELYIYRRRDGSITSRLSVHRMESCFIVFIELWKFWHSNEFPKALDEAFGGYLKGLYSNIKKMKCYFPEVDTLSLGGPAEQLMFKLMTLNEDFHFRYAHLTKAQLNRIKDAEKVIVYGAGSVGIETIQLLQLENIKVDAVAVSNKDINPDNLLGIRIRQIDELTELEHAVIIAAVAEKHREGIVNKLKHLGVLDNAMFLSDSNIQSQGGIR